MISDWLSEDGRKAIEKMGWPTWCDEPRRRLYNVLGNDWEIQAESDAGFDHLEYIDGHVALALLRDRAREWLLEHGVHVNPCRDGGKVMHEALLLLNMDSEDDRDDGETVLPGTAFDYTDYDAALIAAVLATEEGDR